MGIPNRDLIRTPHIDVTEVVEFELRLRNIREVLVNFWIKGQTHKAKPAGYDGAVLIWDVLDTPPATTSDLTLHTMASRTPYPLEFDETERGRTVYIAASWQNERGFDRPVERDTVGCHSVGKDILKRHHAKDAKFMSVVLSLYFQ